MSKTSDEIKRRVAEKINAGAAGPGVTCEVVRPAGLAPDATVPAKRGRKAAE